MIEYERPYSVVPRATPLLKSSGIRGDWADAQRQLISIHASNDPTEWARRMLHDPPPWVAKALSLRDVAVRLAGIKATSSESFRFLGETAEEVLLGSDDRHLNFRASVRCADGAVDVITFVEIHNVLGRVYLWPVRLVHAPMTRRMLRRAARTLDHCEERSAVKVSDS